MSRIFDALDRLEKGNTDPSLASLIDFLPKAAPAAAKPAVEAAIVKEASAPEAGVVTAPAQQATVTPAEPALPPEIPAPRCCPLRVIDGAPLLPFGETDWAAGDQYRMVRTKIVQHPRQPRLIAISSPSPGDGKSVTAINLAAAFSLKSEGNVLLLDGDLRQSMIHKVLGLPESPGLADVLLGTCRLEEALIRAEQFPKLHILTAGVAWSNPSELLDAARWPALCGALRNMFSYVIIDSPPIGSFADWDLIQASCDGVVMVVRLDHTKRKLAKKAVQSLPKENLVGIVLNCVDDWFLNKSNSSYYYQPIIRSKLKD
jgi:capsular exopolysaccharide synthesis family protein